MEHTSDIPSGLPPGYESIAPNVCWVCGKPGEGSHSRYFCHRHPEGIVEWGRYIKAEYELDKSISYSDVGTIEFLDFSKPQLGSPA